MLENVSWLALGVFVADWVIRLLLAGRVVMQRRSVPATLSWLVVLLFAPVVGIVIYLLVGETRLGRHRLVDYNKVASDLSIRAAGLWAGGAEDWTQFDHPLRVVSRVARAESGMPPLKGNALKLLGDSERVLGAMIKDVDAATSHCHLLYYIWQVGGGPDEVARALMRAATRGVACRVLVDAVGSRIFLRSLIAQEMKDAGVHVSAALPVNPVRMLFARLDLRNHRKIAIIDGRIAYTGSQNMTDDLFRVSRRPGIGPWIDATVRVVGPAAHALAVIFLRDWQVDSGEQIADLENYLPGHEERAGEGSVCQVLASGPGQSPDAIHRALLTTIFAAREELIMTTPYFVPDEAMLAALVAAAQRGVQVTIVLPRKIDAPLVAMASRSSINDLLQAGVRIMFHTHGLLHSKTVTVDRTLGLIGSANLDMRSFWLNFEATLIVYDTDFASMLRWMQMGHIASSKPVDPRRWKQRSRAVRLVENIARLLGPLL